MRPLTDLLPDILSQAPGCPDPIALLHLSAATNDFTYRGEVWREWESLSAVANTPVVSLSALSFQTWRRAKRIAALKRGDTGAELTFKTSSQLQRIDPLWRTRTGDLLYWTTEASDAQIEPRLSPYLATGATSIALTGHVVWVTHTYAGVGNNSSDDEQVQLPDRIIFAHREALVCGALARILMIPKRDWSDPRTAAAHRNYYEAAVVNAKSRTDAEHGHPVYTTSYGGY